MKTLGGSLFVCDGIKYDYPFIEAIESLLPVCDQVAVTLFTDEDFDLFMDHFDSHPLNKKMEYYIAARWRFDQTKESKRLAFWTNFTKNMLNTEWHFNLQADEIIHENSYDLIRLAIEEDKEAFIVRRFNLWGDPYHYINYAEIKKRGENGPCGNHTGRLAKIKYLSCMDAENIDAPFVHDYWEAIKTYHMGFVRDRQKMTHKTINIQEKIFECARADEKCYDDIKKNNGEFNPYSRFFPNELTPISEPLPLVIQSWAEKRAYGSINPFKK